MEEYCSKWSGSAGRRVSSRTHRRHMEEGIGQKKVLNDCQIPNALPGTCRQAGSVLKDFFPRSKTYPACPGDCVLCLLQEDLRGLTEKEQEHPEPLRDGRLASFQKSLHDQRQKWERDHPDAELPVAHYYRYAYSCLLMKVQIASILSPYKSQSLTWNRFFNRSGGIEAAYSPPVYWARCQLPSTITPTKTEQYGRSGMGRSKPLAYPVDDNNVALAYWGRQELNTRLDHYAAQVTREGNVCEGYVGRYICEEQFVSFKQAVAVRFKGEENEDGEATFHFYRPTELLHKMFGVVNTDNQWIFGGDQADVLLLDCAGQLSRGRARFPVRTGSRQKHALLDIEQLDRLIRLSYARIPMTEFDFPAARELYLQAPGACRRDPVVKQINTAVHGFIKSCKALSDIAEPNKPPRKKPKPQQSGTPRATVTAMTPGVAIPSGAGRGTSRSTCSAPPAPGRFNHVPRRWGLNSGGRCRVPLGAPSSSPAHSSESDRPERRTALIAAELNRYKVDIAALSETRLPGEGSLTEEGEGYTFFWRGLPLEDRRIHGTGLAVRTEFLRNSPEDPQGVSERLMTWRIPLKDNRYLTIISVYAPTLIANEPDKDEFYASLSAAIRAVPRTNKLVIMGDINARVGTRHHLWRGVLGPHGVGNCNGNGLRLLTLCAEHSLVITNTLFQLREMHKTTWMHPRSKRWHLLDYILVRQCDRKDVRITRAMRGAHCCTDHRVVRTKLNLHIRKPQRKSTRPGKVNLVALKDPTKLKELQDNLANLIPVELDEAAIDTDFLTDAWEDVADTLNTTARRVLGTYSKRNRDWFDEQRDDIRELLEEQHKAHATALRNPTAANRSRFAELRSCTQRELRKMKNTWWKNLAAEIQGHADTGNQQQFYSLLKAAYGPSQGSQFPVRSEDGTTLITGKAEILARWAEHYRKLLNRHTVVDASILDDIPVPPTMVELDDLPTLPEVQAALNSLKNNKAAGPDGVPGEILRCGGEALAQCLLSFVTASWETGCVPQQWKDADLVSIYKKKGDKADCNNSRGISLLSCAGKVLTRILLLRLIKSVLEDVLPESQCGFRKDRSTIDMVFVARQLQEKCREQHQELYLVFIDLTKGQGV
ncbi:hypothetical protein Bbelb_343860 [Branchiostoma belcheri]|nr:hypothetical protein Bbelb_343860 [Branchiostoma belcheri]